MLHALRVLFFRFLVVAVSGAGFAFVLGQVHDYPQTRQAINDYEHGDGLFWVIAFYFVNEAGSGIKYEITGDADHFGYFPRSDIDRTGIAPRRQYDLALLNATQGDWREQLRLSHFLVLGWGVDLDPMEAARWYAVSEQRAKELGEHEQWLDDNRREKVRVFIAKDLEAAEFVKELPEPWEELEGENAEELVTEGQRG